MKPLTARFPFARRVALLLLITVGRSLAFLGPVPPHRLRPSRVTSSPARDRAHTRQPLSLHSVSPKELETAAVDDAPPSKTARTERVSDAGTDLPTFKLRGKVNEIDFCIAPADVSLSRAYGSASEATSTKTAAAPSSNDQLQQPVVLSLTRALNNASNRAVRRILLARSWPSAEALNDSLRQVAELEQRQSAEGTAKTTASAGGARCPVPRPILNVLTRKRSTESQNKKKAMNRPAPRSRSDAEYVQDQLDSFAQKYGDLPGYHAHAAGYLEVILSLATSGVENSTLAQQIMNDGVYDEAYQRILSVLQSVGAQWESILPDDGSSSDHRRIAPQLLDQDICLSTMDKLQMRSQAANSATKKTQMRKNENDHKSKDKKNPAKALEERHNNDIGELGAVLLSAKEPTMTRQLNVLSNIVQRALLFGGDAELLVLSETLFADREAFCKRWYPHGSMSLPNDLSLEQTERPGLQYLNSLIQLLRDCYDHGVVTTVHSPLPLSNSYANAYERLVASAVELGSGYLKPVPDLDHIPKPRSAQEELGRFAVWESTIRNRRKLRDVSAYPEDLEGTWDVRDVIGGETIGVSQVTFVKDGKVQVAPPLEGLRWRLDGGPAHLDTCSFQVLSSDGTILQYRGFIDRGARLESRFSKRPLTIRGSVIFQMRDGSVDYYRDMLPINYRQGTTKFVMTQTVG